MFRTAFLLYILWTGSLSSSENLQQNLRNCLADTWGIDRHTVPFIESYFEDFLIDETKQCHVAEFIVKSEELNISFPLLEHLKPLDAHDGTILAAKFHPVVFENPYIRIMTGCAEPGEREPFHNHAWKSLLVLFEDALYYVEYANGTSEILALTAGVYELLPEDMYACTNLGVKKEKCLRFEVK